MGQRQLKALWKRLEQLRQMKLPEIHRIAETKAGCCFRTQRGPVFQLQGSRGLVMTRSFLKRAFPQRVHFDLQETNTLLRGLKI